MLSSARKCADNDENGISSSDAISPACSPDAPDAMTRRSKRRRTSLPNVFRAVAATDVSIFSKYTNFELIASLSDDRKKKPVHFLHFRKNKTMRNFLDDQFNSLIHCFDLRFRLVFSLGTFIECAKARKRAKSRFLSTPPSFVLRDNVRQRLEDIFKQLTV